MPNFAIKFSDLKIHGAPKERIEWLLWIDAKLQIEVGEQQWFKQPMFPVVELACAVIRWLQIGGDLVFKSMEADETPFLTIQVSKGGCLLSAAWQEFPLATPISESDVREAFGKFVGDLSQVVHVSFGLDIQGLVEVTGGPALGER